MIKIVEPSVLSGKITMPASKSVMHRLLIASALSNGETVINNTLCGDDVRVTADALSALKLKKICAESGFVQLNEITKCEGENDCNQLSNATNCNETNDCKKDGIRRNACLSCENEYVNLNMRESGSSLRFLLPIVCALGMSVEFSGEGRLASRPISELLDVLVSHGIEVDGEKLPLKVRGKLSGGEFVIKGNVSSQYITGLLFALPLISHDSVIVVIGETVSDGYIKLTLDILVQFGIEIVRNGNKFFVKGGQKYVSPKCVTAEGDWSSACFFAVGAAICGDVTIFGLDINSEQSDKYIITLLEKFGADVKVEQLNDGEKKGVDIKNKHPKNGGENDINVQNVHSFDGCKSAAVRISKKDLKAISFSAENCPDLVPIVSVALAAAEGVSKIYGVDRLRFKESDRLSAVIEMLRALGVKCEYAEDCLTIFGKNFNNSTCGKSNSTSIDGKGCNKFESAAIDGKNDHRMVMSAAIAGLEANGETEISKCECVAKSYDNFFEDYAKLGGKVRDKTPN